MMAKDKKKLVINFKTESIEEVHRMAVKLGTSPAGVISQALALFRAAQGRKIVLKDEKNNVDLEIKTYSDQSARVKGIR
jgi:hypothetical protein